MVEPALNDDIFSAPVIIKTGAELVIIVTNNDCYENIG